MNDVLLFLLAQSDCPDPDTWLDALDDQFGELSAAERHRLAEICDRMLSTVRESVVMDTETSRVRHGAGRS